LTTLPATTEHTMTLSPIEDILKDLKAGRMIVLVDDEDRENEGDFVCAAEHVDVEMINFMTRIGGGYLCVSLTGDACDRLDLAPQSAVNTSLRTTPFTVSVDGHPRHGIGTGISASDRVKTIQMLADSTSRPDDFVRPGHINPLRARDGGTLVRTGQTEGSVDLMRLAGLTPAAVIIEVVRPDGEMARMPDLEQLCAKHDLKMCSVEQVIEYRLERESLVQRVEPHDGTPIDTPYGTFTLYSYRSAIDPMPHIALVVGELGDGDEPTLVRVQRRDLLGDIFDATDRPTGTQLRACLRQLQDAGRGVLVYLRPEHMGDGLLDQLQSIQRPDRDDPDRPDLTRADGIGSSRPIEERELGTGSQILRDLGVQKLRLLTNSPKPYPGLHGYGLEIVENVPISDEGHRD
jgi:3,4-dihydroxy 2-butanone 4-phosphate synthase/GTP cyclohydrolase II